MEINELDYIPFSAFEDARKKRHVYMADIEKGLTRWSKSAVEYFDLPGEYIENAKDVWYEKVHPNDRNMYREDIEKIFTLQKTDHNLDYRVMNRFGNYVFCTCIGKVMEKEDGNGHYFVGTIENHNVSGRIDSVTELYNVYSFLCDGAEYRNGDDEDTLLMVGINRFSDINKTYGYEFGNKVLKCMADEMVSMVGSKGRCYRMDGVKFCIAGFGAGIEEMNELYDKLVEKCHIGFVIEGVHISFSIAGGIVKIDDKEGVSEYSLQAILGYVIEKSKHSRHSELVVFQNGKIDDARENLATMEAIRKSVFEGMKGFYLCYQPIIDVKSGSISGMEALIRWNREPFGEVSPGVFIPWLEDDPCIYQLGNWVLRQALADAKKIIRDYPNFVVNVNVSAEQIERTGFRKSVKNILEELVFPAGNLCMELTERVMSLDLDFLRGELEFFRDMGIKIALDDFGTGVSSFNLLLELPVDNLKIDRNFVKDINTNKAEQLIVETIAFCADGMSLDICVEGVENEEMKEFLKRYKIAKHQGFLYSKPVVYEKFISLLK